MPEAPQVGCGNGGVDDAADDANVDEKALEDATLMDVDAGERELDEVWELAEDETGGETRAVLDNELAERLVRVLESREDDDIMLLLEDSMPSQRPNPF